MNEKKQEAPPQAVLLVPEQKLDVSSGLADVRAAFTALDRELTDNVTGLGRVITHRRVEKSKIRALLIDLQRGVCLAAEGAGLDPKQLTDDVHNGRG